METQKGNLFTKLTLFCTYSRLNAVVLPVGAPPSSYSCDGEPPLLAGVWLLHYTPSACVIPTRCAAYRCVPHAYFRAVLNVVST